MNLQDPSSKRKKCLKVLGFSAVGLAGLLAVWIVGGNYIASVQEKEIDRDLAAFAQRFPNTEPNDSAFKLAALLAKLGLKAGGGSLNFASQRDGSKNRTMAPLRSPPKLVNLS
jgi:hypothetical protein